MKNDKYFVLDIRHRAETLKPYEIYKELAAVKDYGIPFIPVRIKNTSGNGLLDFISNLISFFTNKNSKLNNVQIALPRDIDSMLIFNMTSKLNDEYDVKLLGEKARKQLKFEINPRRYGTNFLTLGRRYKGLGK